MKQKYLNKLQEYEEYLKAKLDYYQKYLEAKQELKNKSGSKDKENKYIPNKDNLSEDIDDLRANVERVDKLSEILTDGESPSKSIIAKEIRSYKSSSEYIGKHNQYVQIDLERRKKKEEEALRIRKETEKHCKEKYNIELPETSYGIPKGYDLPYSSKLVVDDKLFNDDNFVSCVLDREFISFDQNNSKKDLNS